MAHSQHATSPFRKVATITTSLELPRKLQEAARVLRVGLLPLPVASLVADGGGKLATPQRAPVIDVRRMDLCRSRLDRVHGVGASAIDSRGLRRKLPLAAVGIHEQEACRVLLAVAVDGMAQRSVAILVAVEVDEISVRATEVRLAVVEAAGRVRIFEMRPPGSVAEAAGRLDAEESQVLARQEPRFVLADHLAIDGNRDSGQRPARIEARHLVAGLLLRRLIVVVADQQVPENIGAARPAFAAPLGAA